VRLLLLSSVILFSVAFADQILWDYSLTEPPPGWTYDEDWECNADGMSILLDQYMGGIKNENVYTGLALTPMGTDSLTLSISQIYNGYKSDYANVGASIYLSVNGTNWNRIWHTFGTQVDSTGVYETIDGVIPGDLVAFRICASGAGIEGESYYLDWTLGDLVLTAHGNIQALDQQTWAKIKSLF